MSDHDPRYLEQLPAYAIGALDGEELRELEGHLETGCAECERELVAWRDDVEALAALAPPVMPSEVTRARILGLASPPKASRPPVDVMRMALAAALGALLVGGWLHLGLRQEVSELARERSVASERLEQFEAELVSTRSELAILRLGAGIAASPQMRLVALEGLVDPGEAFGQAFVDPMGRRAIFYAYGLRPTEEGKTYQLWFIADGAPVSAGIFEVDSRGRAVVLVEEVAPVESIDAWAVTVEPAGGVNQPTGTMVLKG